MASVEQLWSEFLASGLPFTDEAARTGYTSWCFGSGPEMADELVGLVLSGSKRATAGSLWSYEAEGEPVPTIGDFSVVTDGAGQARCVIRTTEVGVVPFADVDAEFARAEGEGDLSLEYWRAGHWRYFTRELAALGRVPDEAMPVVCERFDVVYPSPGG